MGVGKPGVKGEDGNLDGKGRKEEDKNPVLPSGRNVQRQPGDHVEGEDAADLPVQKGHNYQADEEKDASRHGVDNELEGGVAAVGAAPDPDDEEHGDEHRLPEDIEQNGVEGGKDAENPRFQDKKGDEVGLFLALDPVPGHQDGGDGEQARQGQHEHGKTVDAQVI